MNGQRILSIVAVWAGVGLFLPAPASAHPEFVGGHLFVSVRGGEGCFGFPKGPEAIVEIDPTTGALSVFADGASDGLCFVNGLRFTPDARRLFALNLGHINPVDGGWVQAFNPDGTSEVILDASDGLVGPNGANALAFDASGNLYVVNGENSTILRFPADGGAATVFADFTDGILGRGALDFAPNGDLFYCGDLADAIIRITPEGKSSVFDPLLKPTSLAFDRQGNLFVAAGPKIFRYDNGNANSRRILASGFVTSSGSPLPLTLSRDGTIIYVADLSSTVYTVDAEDGTTKFLVDISQALLYFARPNGITVFAPPTEVPTVSRWGVVVTALLVLGVGALVLIRRRSVSITRKG